MENFQSPSSEKPQTAQSQPDENTTDHLHSGINPNKYNTEWFLQVKAAGLQ